MAQGKARPTRARTAKTADGAETPPKATRKRAPASTTSTGTAARARRKPVDPRTPEDIATHAYLMWERGEPGDATEHWLRAEQELLAA